MLNLNTHPKTKPEPTLIFKNCSYVCVSLCTTVVHCTEQNSYDNFPLILQIIIIAQMMLIARQGEEERKEQRAAHQHMSP